MDFNNLFNQAVQNAQSSVNDIVATGKPALEASLEKWGADTLSQMAGQSQKDLNNAVKQIASKPQSPGSFGAALSATLQSSFLSQYGLYIILAIVVLLFVGSHL